MKKYILYYDYSTFRRGDYPYLVSRSFDVYIRLSDEKIICFSFVRRFNLLKYPLSRNSPEMIIDSLTRNLSYEISLQDEDLCFSIGFFQVDQDFLDTVIYAKIKDKNEEVIQAWEQLKQSN